MRGSADSFSHMRVNSVLSTLAGLIFMRSISAILSCRLRSTPPPLIRTMRSVFYRASVAPLRCLGVAVHSGYGSHFKPRNRGSVYAISNNRPTRIEIRCMPSVATGTAAFLPRRIFMTQSAGLSRATASITTRRPLAHSNYNRYAQLAIG